MKKSSILKTIEEFKEAKIDAESENYESINIKPSASSSALLEVLSRVAKKTPSALINPNLSECIASRVLEAASSLDLLQEAVIDVLDKNSTFTKESAVGILKKHEFIKITEKTLHHILKNFKWNTKKHT